jgi:ribosomal 30S subunit maturation factor RimM
MENKVLYGFIERTHGLRGRMILKLFVFGPAVPIEEGTLLYTENRTLTVTRSRKRDNERVTVDCKEVWTKDQASELTGESIQVDTNRVLKPGFPLPVYGFSEFTMVSRGVKLPVEEVEYNSSNPQLIVKGDRGLFPVPLALALTGEIDSAERTITIDLPEGLEEI